MINLGHTTKVLEDEYRRKDLLVVPSSYPGLLKAVQRTLKGIPDELPAKSLEDKLTHLRVLPLLEQLDIHRYQLEHGSISQQQSERLTLLEKKYQSLARTKPLQQVVATDLQSSKTRMIRFNPKRRSRADLKYILTQNGMCYADKRRISDITNHFYDDSILGGSVILTVEKGAKGKKIKYGVVERRTKQNNPILAVLKLFLGVDKTGDVVLTADHFSAANYFAKRIGDWANDGKIDLFAYGPVASLYLAERLGVSKVVFGDNELEEFGKACGLTARSTFHRLPNGKNSGPADSRKVGIISHPNNQDGVWQHSLYRVPTGRQVIYDLEPLSIDNLFDEFNQVQVDLRTEISNKGKLRKGYLEKLRIDERFSMMRTILRIMEDAYLKNRRFMVAKSSYNSSIDLIKSKDRDFSRPYVN